jgi:hypothetical protein
VLRSVRKNVKGVRSCKKIIGEIENREIKRKEKMNSTLYNSLEDNC